jgi:hypothetical protein
LVKQAFVWEPPGRGKTQASYDWNRPHQNFSKFLDHTRMKEGKSLKGCTLTRITGRSGRAGSQVSAEGVPSGHPGIVSKDPRIVLM